MRRLSTFIAITLLLASAYGEETNSSYVQRIQAGRIEKEAGIKSEHGLLSYIGSYQLKEGENRLGSDPLYEIHLPVHSAPTQVGKFILINGRATFTSSVPELVSLNGRSVSTVELPETGCAHLPLYRWGVCNSSIVCPPTSITEYSSAIRKARISRTSRDSTGTR